MASGGELTQQRTTLEIQTYGSGMAGDELNIWAAREDIDGTTWNNVSLSLDPMRFNVTYGANNAPYSSLEINRNGIGLQGRVALSANDGADNTGKYLQIMNPEGEVGFVDIENTGGGETHTHDNFDFLETLDNFLVTDGDGSQYLGDDGEYHNAVAGGQIQSDWNQSDSSRVDYIQNKPTIEPQVNPDWNATSGKAQILNKPTISNDFTTTEKQKLAGIANGAEVNVNPDWNATSGKAQILNKPTIEPQVNPDWNATSGKAQILNKPNLSNSVVFAYQNNLIIDTATPKFIVASISASAAISIVQIPQNQYVNLMVHNTSGAAITVQLPNTANDIKAAAAAVVEIAAGKRIEYTVITDGTLRYWQRSEELS